MTLCDPAPEYSPESTGQHLNLPEGTPALEAFYLYLTSGCNLRCRHCWITPSFVNGEPSPGEYLDPALLRRAVAEAKPLGLRKAKLTGGEPVLHPQFVEITDMLTTEGLLLEMETNGTLIDESLARHLKERTNLAFVSVSIDGPTAETHDSFRGVEGCFDRAVRGFRHLVEAGFRPQLIMSVHHGNVELVEAVVELAIRLGAGSVKFNLVTRSGRGIAMHEHGEALDFDEAIRLSRTVRKKQQQSPIRLILNMPPALRPVKQLVNEGAGATCHVRHILGILGSGDLALCGIGRSLPELCFGNLREISIAEVWSRHQMLQRLRRDLDAEFPGVCGQCIHARRCLTLCVAQNYLDSGQFITPHWLCAEAQERKIFPTTRTRGGVKEAWWRRPDPLSILPLHASAVVADGKALVFLGPSETGKSTIREALSQSQHFQSLADDAVYLIPKNDHSWHVANADDGWVFRGPLPDDRAYSLESVPVKAIFRLYQAPAPHLERLDSFTVCYYMVQAFFEVSRHTWLDVQDMGKAFARLATVARSTPGYRLHCDLSPRTVETVTSAIENLR